MKPSTVPLIMAFALLAGASSHAQTIKSSAGELSVRTAVAGLDHPWALTFLPDGRLLITERPGRMRIAAADGALSPALAGLPRVFATNQGGLHDVALDRRFAANRTIYFCFAEPADGGARTSLARALLPEGGPPRLEEVKVIFRQDGPLSSGHHFGCRIAQSADDNLFLSMGDHGRFPGEAQNLANHIGKIVRVRPDGSVPPDNPFVGRAGARPEIWSLGHRNAQGLALLPGTDKLWEHEHGPRGGDEVNLIERGRNYGWPVIGFGIDYSGARIHESTHKTGMEQPAWYWVPSIAPSGMTFYDGTLWPAWRGNLLVGALAGRLVTRLELSGDKIVKEERLALGARVRDVRQGPDGALWLATDETDGRILRIAPAR